MHLPQDRTHVVAFFPDGGVEHTRHADLDEIFGTEGLMERVTDIGRHREGYFIKWIRGPLAVREHTYGMAGEYGTVNPEHLNRLATMRDEILYFKTYEFAVAHEVQVLNAMRKAGIRFNG